MKSCAIFGAGDFDGYVLPGAQFVIAADGGLAYTEKYAIQPDLILGDFDSLGYVPEDARVFPVEKDDTDAMLAVKAALERGFDEILLYGCLGGERLDHSIAALQTLAYIAEQGAAGWLIGSDNIVTVVKNGELRFPAGCSGILSVFCQGGDAEGVTIRGAGYEARDVTLTASFPLGVSNHFIGQETAVSVKSGSLLVLWDRENGLPERRNFG